MLLDIFSMIKILIFKQKRQFFYGARNVSIHPLRNLAVARYDIESLRQYALHRVAKPRRDQRWCGQPRARGNKCARTIRSASPLYAIALCQKHRAGTGALFERGRARGWNSVGALSGAHKLPEPARQPQRWIQQLGGSSAQRAQALALRFADRSVPIEDRRVCAGSAQPHQGRSGTVLWNLQASRTGTGSLRRPAGTPPGIQRGVRRAK